MVSTLIFSRNQKSETGQAFWRQSLQPLLKANSSDDYWKEDPEEKEKQVVKLLGKAREALMYVTTDYNFHHRNRQSMPEDKDWQSWHLGRGESLHPDMLWSNIGGFFLNASNPAIYNSDIRQRSHDAVKHAATYQATCANLDKYRLQHTRCHTAHDYLKLRVPIASLDVQSIHLPVPPCILLYDT